MATGRARRQELEHEALVDKEPSFVHEGLADYILETTGIEVDVKTVQLALALITPFRQSEAYEDVQARKQEARDEAEQAKLDRIEQRKEDRRAKLRAQLEAIDDDAPSVRSSRTVRSAGRAAKAPAKAAKRGRPAKATSTPAPAKKRGRPAKTAAPTEKRGELRSVPAEPSTANSDDDEY